MRLPQPRRLTRAEYRVAALAPRVFRHELRAPVAVHWHEFYELVLVERGEGRHVVNGRPHRAVPGSAFLLAPTDVHALVPAGGTPLVALDVVFDAAAFDAALDGVAAPTATLGPRAVERFTAGAGDLRRLWDESRRARPGRDAVMQAALRCALIELARSCPGTATTGDAAAVPLDAAIRRAVRYIDHHFHEPLRLADVARHAHLSPNYFSERFHALTGTSFQRYLRERRLDFARALLAATDMSVTAVCHAAGFNDLSHFGRAFRQRHGHPPAADRRRRRRPPNA